VGRARGPALAAELALELHKSPRQRVKRAEHRGHRAGQAGCAAESRRIHIVCRCCRPDDRRCATGPELSKLDATDQAPNRSGFTPTDTERLGVGPLPPCKLRSSQLRLKGRSPLSRSRLARRGWQPAKDQTWRGLAKASREQRRDCLQAARRRADGSVQAVR